MGYGLYALSSGTGFLAPVIRKSSRELDLSTGRSGPHDFAVRTDTFVGTLDQDAARPHGHRSPPRVS
jgi:hypothetical protein